MESSTELRLWTSDREKRQKGVGLNVIERWTEEIIGDPGEAHKDLTGAFTQWCLSPDQCRGRLYKGDYFHGHSESDAVFLKDTSYTGDLKIADDLFTVQSGGLQNAKRLPMS